MLTLNDRVMMDLGRMIIQLEEKQMRIEELEESEKRLAALEAALAEQNTKGGDQ